MPYIGTSPSNGVRRVFDYTATAGQTSFSGTDNNSQTLSYSDSNFIDVFQNGILLLPSDYTATTGTTVVLDTGATVSDSVQIVAFDVFSVADTVSKADGGTFDGNVTMAGTLGVTGVPTFTGRSVHSGGITVANDGQIGSVGDADAIAISSSGVATFSQSPVGTGLNLLLNATISSAVSEYDISSTYINSTYDAYWLQASLLPATDGANAYARVFVGGAVQTGSIYGIEVAGRDGSYYTSGNATEQFYFNRDTCGNATGEGLTYQLLMQNVNSTTRPFTIEGGSNTYTTSGNHKTNGFGGSLIVANASNVVNGFRLYFNTGNIASGTVQLYGLRK